ncbi:MAG TPA: hypothetical protein V6C90_04145 [Coleofasciculaceae cyanobacterium]
MTSDLGFWIAPKVRFQRNLDFGLEETDVASKGSTLEVGTCTGYQNSKSFPVRRVGGVNSKSAIQNPCIGWHECPKQSMRLSLRRQRSVHQNIDYRRRIGHSRSGKLY